MNTEDAKEWLPLAQAMADGKTIQNNFMQGEWKDTEWIETIDGLPSEYRIKPEPRTFEMWLFNPMGRMYPFVEGEECFAENEQWERITVMEVLK